MRKILAGGYKKSMRKHTQNVFIDVLSFICFITLFLTGLLIHFILPPGSHGDSFLGLTRHEWGDIHFWLALIFTVVILFHLILHISWIKASLFKGKSKG